MVDVAVRVCLRRVKSTSRWQTRCTATALHHTLRIIVGRFMYRLACSILSLHIKRRLPHFCLSSRYVGARPDDAQKLKQARRLHETVKAMRSIDVQLVLSLGHVPTVDRHVCVLMAASPSRMHTCFILPTRESASDVLPGELRLPEFVCARWLLTLAALSACSCRVSW